MAVPCWPMPDIANAHTVRMIDQALLSIANTGPTIQAGEIARLLRPFERLIGETSQPP